ncbi:hypothetical protein M097_3005 [Phocaeicola vulgatus str. 3775 SL(B) 10 (iv)]|uniref:Uncharacterized protein n=1 Tax=Phocaeicola vulgatus str. 3775 SL(B) 10 (iv) TaxID=1339350 RepID=A0A078R3C1_PHOVU|nr:hypothetical protein M097_3005 [Phocaeicola vulgatus str. 3775 SL(B) 10 (iv)]
MMVDFLERHRFATRQKLYDVQAFFKFSHSVFLYSVTK